MIQVMIIRGFNKLLYQVTEDMGLKIETKEYRMLKEIFSKIINTKTQKHRGERVGFLNHSNCIYWS